MLTRRPAKSTAFPYTTLFRSGAGSREQDVPALVKAAQREAESARARTVIVDTAGRLQIDAEMMDELKRSEEHTSELQSLTNLVCRLLLETKKNIKEQTNEENR